MGIEVREEPSAARSAAADEISVFEREPELARRSGSALLKWSLRIADAIALAGAFLVAQALWPTLSASAAPVALWLVAYVAVGCWMISKQGLYLARVATMRTVEQAGLARACLVLAAGGLAIDLLRDVHIAPARIAFAGLLAFGSLTIIRTAYRAWLKAARRGGRFMRPVIIVGIDEQTSEISALMSEHPELGFEPVGVFGDRAQAEAAQLGDLWRGDISEVGAALAGGEVTGAIVSSTAVDPSVLNSVTRTLFEARCHVHLSTGITGIDQRRIRPMHLGYEPLLYVEPLELTSGQLLAKRVLDVTVSAIVSVLVSPLVLVSALAIKLDDRGPVLFRQQRVGRDGRHFTIIKLRTMTVGAEEHLDELLPYNERNGPLFKMAHDPRVTRVGRVLRELNIDELPQLWNVLRGDMSLVGPRPALPTEALCFGERLRSRTQVLPGVTGLWQVEARNSGSMHSYERLDLFYVENWSVGLDVMVIIATVEEELVKALRHLVPRRRHPAAHPAVLAASAGGGSGVGEGLPGEV